MNENLHYAINRPDVIDERFEDEYVIVNLRDGTYYGLREIGAVLWDLIIRGETSTEIVTTLSEHFPDDLITIERAVQGLLSELEQEGLILRDPSPTMRAGTPARPIPIPSAPFPPPILEKYTDMREVLQLDPIHEVDDSGWPAAKP